MASKSVAAAVDWTRIYGSLNLGKETVSALQAFRKRHSEAQRVHDQLKATQPTIDIAHYRSILKNKAVVDEAESILKGFKPVTYDVSEHVKAIEAFETKAVATAEATEQKIDSELKGLQATLANIEEARPFEDLTLDDVSHARPEVLQATETMIKKGKWSVPGYKEKFGDLNMM
ncbi:ATP synthase d subunit [Tulasnella sp. 330]|nr:ATP synthase d subunit [Tulasnella sp. 330]KAG8866111.1 ATP synthase d subunit [Tulasnella sp. 331]KAG8885958.1 ATP synthase d subunit [Tulasnella sp. 332]